jgi:hypothetical protein
VTPLFTVRWLFVGYPLAALYGTIVVGEIYHRIRRLRFKRRVRRFEEAQAAARAARDSDA